MTENINNFITIVRRKNGQVKITYDIINEGNIYKLLRDLGYRKSKLDNKRIYFRRQGPQIIRVNIQDIKHAFLEVLKKLELKNTPPDINRTMILNWYYQQQPIKENGLFDHYLEDSLSDIEAHNFHLQTDSAYKHRFEVQQLLNKFDEWTFCKTVDDAGAFCKGNPLYYKNVGDKKYLVFNHYNSKAKKNDGFDSWLVKYMNEKHIGSKKPLDIKEIRLSFQIERDFH